MKNLFTSIVCILLLGSAPAYSQNPDEYMRIWKTERGTMALWQYHEDIGTGIGGSGIHDEHGTIGGQIAADYGRFYFNWNDGVDGQGDGWFKLNVDMQKFDGQWANKKDINKKGTWSGDVVAENAFNIGDHEALSVQSGEMQGSTPQPETRTSSTELPPATERRIAVALFIIFMILAIFLTMSTLEKKCPKCKGTGSIKGTRLQGEGDYWTGDGPQMVDYNYECDACKGKGIVKKKK
jgi:hypothetical protein